MKVARMLLLTVPLLVASAQAQAQEDPHAILKHAMVLFDLGKFIDAAGQYERVYMIKPVPDLLYNIAQSYRLGGDIEKGLFFYRRYLAKAPNAKNAAEVQRRISELEAVTAAQRSPPNDTTPVSTAPPTRTPRKTPPEKTPTEKPTPVTTTPTATVTATTTTTTPTTATTTTTTTTPPPEEPTQPAATSKAITEPPPPARPAKGGSKVGVVVGVTVAGVLVLGGVGVGLGVGLAPSPSFNATVPDIGPGPHMGALVGF